MTWWKSKWFHKISLKMSFPNRVLDLASEYCKQLFNWSMWFVLLMTKQLILKGFPMFDTKEKMWRTWPHKMVLYWPTHPPFELAMTHLFRKWAHIFNFHAAHINHVLLHMSKIIQMYDEGNGIFLFLVCKLF